MNRLGWYNTMLFFMNAIVFCGNLILVIALKGLM